ncbi:MAG: phosphoenolpyruvate--protein phosphotransferase [Ruminococcaceae bacterium]|nr:phosphoenolpyruvate--protein phosphotransferase [Oscillospiraceae bacterium]
MKKSMQESRIFRGTGISSGRQAGRLRFFQRISEDRHAVTDSQDADPQAEWNRLEIALRTTADNLTLLYQRAEATAGAESAEIFQIHGMLLEDQDFLDAIKEELHGGACAERALTAATDRFANMLGALQDPYLSARAADLRDLEHQLQRALAGGSKTTVSSSDEPFLLVADDLSPSETVMLEKNQILGFITFRGTPNSHTAILARAMGIPALVGVGRIDEEYDGAYALLDAAEGSLTVSPTDEEKSLFFEKQRLDDRIAQEHDRYLRGLMNKPAVTRSGHHMLIYANIGDGSEVSAALSNGADGIGLLRSEFLYLGSSDYPSEERLFKAYSDIAVRMQGKRTVIRTLDIGADKRIPYFGLPEEENPALGFRAIRICLAREPLFKTQLRAILRAASFGRLSIMLPMIVSVDEVRQSKRLLEECKEELLREGVRFEKELELGIMIETPAAALMSEELAQEVDFFSVGTNDLTQYTLAADRQNPALAKLCEENREPILRLIKKAADAIHHTGGWIGICGEMAADLLLTQQFADMRIDELSVSVPYLLGLRGKVSECK